VGAEPPTERVAMNRRRSRRKADRPPRLMARSQAGRMARARRLRAKTNRLAEPPTGAFVTLTVAQAGQRPTPRFGCKSW